MFNIKLSQLVQSNDKNLPKLSLLNNDSSKVKSYIDMKADFNSENLQRNILNESENNPGYWDDMSKFLNTEQKNDTPEWMKGAADLANKFIVTGENSFGLGINLEF